MGAPTLECWGGLQNRSESSAGSNPVTRAKFLVDKSMNMLYDKNMKKEKGNKF